MKISGLHPGRGHVATVAAGSASHTAGLRAGDLIVSLNGHQLRDVIDYQFYLETGVNELIVERDNQRLALQMQTVDGADPGISFSSAIFDRIRTCRCKCIICFVQQLPAGLRPSLYLRDDDFRLSFLYGNFTTLGNLREEDIARILDQRLSPLYVSVHATDPEVRARLMGISLSEAARGLDVLRMLGDGGIQTHIQIVLCPGINDEEVLRQTVDDLACKYQNVGSVAVVPVAASAQFLERQASLVKSGAAAAAFRPVTLPDCQAVIAYVTSIQQNYRRERGTGFVYAADEFYLRAGSSLPPVSEYDDFPQYENGVGIAASFVNEAKQAIESLLATAESGEEGAGRESSDGEEAAGGVYLLSGVLAAGIMMEVCDRLSSSLSRGFRPLIAENHTFGPHVTVTGLLGGKDILSAAQTSSLGPGDLLLIPRACLSDDDQPRFIDDMSLDELKEEVRCTILVSP